MFTGGFHSLGWNLPYRVIDIDLIPRCQPYFAGTTCREDHKPQRELDG